MNRRSFLLGSSALVGGMLLEKAIPFGRVWSFPKEIVIAKSPLEQTSGLGCLDLVEGTGPLSVRVGNGGIFYEGMEVEIFGGREYLLRGKCKIDRIEGGTLTMSHVPKGTAPGDLVLLPAPSIAIHHADPRTGEFKGLSRAQV